MMGINVSQLLKAPVGSTQKYEVSETVDVAGGESVVKGEVELVRTGQGILIKGMLDTAIDTTCSRCLGLFNYPLTLDIEEEYFPTTDVISGAPLPLPEAPGCFTIDEHYILDLTEAINQQLLLAVPMKLLCRKDCAGLCPECGRNLNQGPCDCLPQEVDTRWSKLSKSFLANDA